VEEERFTHELRRDGIRTAKMLKEKGIISPSLVGAVKINHNTWVVPKIKKDGNSN
jgi:predicted transcriptional regulator